MTTRDKLKNLLIDNGMFEGDAETVLTIAIPEIEKLVPNYRITWDRPAEEYPTTMYSMWWMTTKPIALKWINENQPNAWFKVMFE